MSRSATVPPTEAPTITPVLLSVWLFLLPESVGLLEDVFICCGLSDEVVGTPGKRVGGTDIGGDPKHEESSDVPTLRIWLVPPKRF